MSIRNAARAIIINNEKILVNKYQNSLKDICYGLSVGEIYYDLPGGGQNQYETLEDAVERECLEETGHIINVDRLVAICEEISMNEKFRKEYEEYAHKVHFIFICHLAADKFIKPIANKDLDMIDSVWIDINEMKDLPLYPSILKNNIELILQTKGIVYLGTEYV